jgi:FkbH-like protein
VSTSFGTRTYPQIAAELRGLRKTVAGRPYRVSLLTNVLVNSLPTLLEWAFLTEGVPATVTQTNFDNIVQDSADLGDVDAAIVFMDLAGFAAARPDLGAMTREEETQFADGLQASVLRVLSNLDHTPLVVFNLFTALPFESRALRGGALGRIADELNRAVRANAGPNVVLVDLEKIYAAVGLAKSIDFRMFHSARGFQTIDFLRSWVDLVLPAFRSATGRARKVLVVDCDNTLWGGIVGEDGVDGLRLGDATRDGPFFREAQHVMKALQAQGVLLAIASKNNPEDVRAAFAGNPDMVLEEADFVAMEVGWDEKIHALTRVAKVLNLGTDSLVFLDDSPFELERVRSALPQVACLSVPESISDYPQMLRESADLFFNLSQTDEDKRRTQMYREDIERKRATAVFQSADDYVASLQVSVAFAEGAAINTARAAQMSQKTNQFNLTTRRYTEADILRMTSNPDCLVATFAVGDRFGDYGVTGLVILHHDRQQASARLDTLLMSCRVLGRKVEDVVFAWIEARMRDVGVSTIYGEYIPSAKNKLVDNLLDRFGFAPNGSDEASYRYKRDL